MAFTSSHHTPIPCLPGLPLFGNVFALRNKRLELLQRISHEFGDIGAFHFGPSLVPVLNSPEFIRQVLVDQSTVFEKTATVRALGTPVLGNSVFLSEGEEHRRQRRLLAPHFQHSRVGNYAEIMVDCTERLQETWNEGEVIDLADEMMRLTLWIISKVLFDADIFGEERELGKALTYTFRHFASAATNPLRLPQSWPTPQNRRAQQALAYVNATIYRKIEERRQGDNDRGDFLSSLLRAQDEEHADVLSNQQVRNEILSLFVAGHETVATALTWCWYLLSQHPEVYTRMKLEGDRVLAGRLPTVTDLSNLPYTLQVFKEALRLYPSVYAFTRGSTAPVQLGEYYIPKGTSVVISPYTLHRRAKFFPNPERFNPDRFAPQQEHELVRYSYLPFGAGPHICLGMHFALLEGHLLLATLTQRLNFEFVGSEPVEPEPLLTLRPKGKILMRVRR
ncbi:cytochrome P450 [Ktedonospora formicarum]|uniref:Cytochrome P450 n=1 Tax=Ktedonospora formicarum TaxID=2778364 RepID=A0A8J3MVS8_9CHLR|nr:cytochrome P450 [Ktedonospora formicarum]GHO49645.1 cytochrome P450 [Ktedonospora formicarum]